MEILVGTGVVILVAVMFLLMGLNMWVFPIFRRRSEKKRRRGQLRDSHQRMTRELDVLAEQKPMVQSRFIMVKDRVSQLRLDPLQKALDKYYKQEIDAVAEAGKLPLGWPDNVIDAQMDTEADLETSAKVWQMCHDAISSGKALLQELEDILASFREVEGQLAKFQDKSDAVDKRLTELIKQGHRLGSYREIWQSSRELADQSRESLKKGAYKQALSRVNQAVTMLEADITAKVDERLKLQAAAQKGVADLKPLLEKLRDQIQTVSRVQLTQAKARYSPDNWQPAEEFLTKASAYIEDCLAGFAELEDQIGMQRQEWQSAMDTVSTVATEAKGLSDSLKQVTDQFASLATVKDKLSAALTKAQADIDELWPFMIRYIHDIPNELCINLQIAEEGILRDQKTLDAKSMELYQLATHAAEAIKLFRAIEFQARQGHETRAQARARKLN